ncbi:MAG: FG-GAP-like repeat-containing protein [Candidatus Eisenbacteria bacterium]
MPAPLQTRPLAIAAFAWLALLAPLAHAGLPDLDDLASPGASAMHLMLPDLGLVTRQFEADRAQATRSHLADPTRLAQSTSVSGSVSWSDESNASNRRLGLSSAPAGDVNGDGYSDFVALGDLNSFNTALYLYLGSATGPTLAPGYPVTNLPAGGEVSAAGDVNGDGYGDIILYWYLSGMVRVYRGGPSGFDLVSFNQIGSLGTNLYGLNAAPAGDINGDGFDDIIFGMPSAAGFYPCTPSAYSGVVEVFYGSAAGVSASNYWVITGCHATGASARLGTSVAGAGDVNGDGFADIVFSAPQAADLTGFAGVVGKVYVMYGAAAGLPLLPGFSNLGSVNSGTTILGHHTNADFGASVGPAGDLNGDGYADIAIGAPSDDYFVADGGLAFVFRGAAAGVDTAWANQLWWEGGPSASAQFGLLVTPAGDVNGDGLPDLLIGESGRVDLAQSTGGTLTIEQSLGYPTSTSRVSTAGDVNGDGLSDILVGDQYFTNVESNEGRVLIHFGLGSPPSNYANWTTTQTVVDNPNLGWSVASAGDVNGDGYDDVIVGAPTWYDWLTPGSYNNGLVLLFYGHPTGLSPSYDWYTYGVSDDQLGISVASAGDVNGDGYGDVIMGAHTSAGGVGQARVWYGSAFGLGSVPNVTITGYSAGANFGASVASAGDVNGDGYPDVIVGAPQGVDPANPLSGEGRAYVYLGGAGGVNPALYWAKSGLQTDAHLGTSVAPAGDVNGDSYADVVIGAPDYDQTGKFGIVTPDAGRVVVVFGSQSGPNVSTNLNIFSPWRMGASVASAGDVNGDGYSDVLVGGPSATFTASGEGVVRVYAGYPGGVGGQIWTQYGGEVYGGFGSAVSSAGDVDGDGLSDVLVGAVFQDMGGPQDQGRAYVYRGPLAAGGAPFWTGSGGSPYANMGHALANAGDVNGDGWSDLAFGMPGYTNVAYRQGFCQVHLGARATARNQIAIPFRLSPATRIVHSGNLSDPGQFLLLAHGRSAAGRTNVRMQYRVTPVAGFALLPITGIQTAWAPTGSPGANGSIGSIGQYITGLTAGVPFAWQMRALARSVYFPTGIWRGPVRSGRLETDLRAPGTWVDVAATAAPAQLRLADVHPNPLRTTTTIAFTLTRSGPVALTVIDVQGRRLRSLVQGVRAAGEHRLDWDSRDQDGKRVEAGIYFLRLEAEGRSLHRKVAVMR